MNTQNGSWKKSDLKKSNAELQEYLMFQRRGTKEENRKRYLRKKKHKRKAEEYDESKYY